MVDAKITELPAIAIVSGVDLLAVVDNPLVTPVTTKATVDQLATFLASNTITLLNKTLTTPIIVATGFVNMQHTHQAANTGGVLVATLALTATGTKDSTTFLRGDNTWAVPPVGGSGITSINADTTAAQIIAAGTGLGIVDVGATHTLSIDSTVVTLTGTQILTNKTLTTPTIVATGFTNMQHTHLAANTGGTITAAAISDFSSAVAATASVTANTAKVTNATHTGDVTGATALTIANNAVITAKILNSNVTLAKIQNIATARFLGRVTAATGVVEELTGTQATTLLNVFTSTLKGLVPLSGGSATEFLSADGTFKVPAGGGDMVLADIQIVTGLKTFGTIGGAVGKFRLAGSTSGSTIVNAAAVAGTTTITFPGTTGTVVITGLASQITLGTEVTGAITNLSDVTAKTGTGTIAVFDTSPTIVTPVIASFVTAQHNHQAAAGGSQLVATLALTATGTKDSTTFLRGDDTWAVPAGGTGITSINSLTAAAQTLTQQTDKILINSVTADHAFTLGTDVVTIDKANTYEDFNQTFKDNRILIESPDTLTPVTIINLQQTLARNLSIPILTGNRNFVVTGESSQITLGTEVTGAITNLSDVTAKTGTGTTVVFGTSPTIVTPVIVSFTTAQHNHLAAAGGGTITAAAISDFSAAVAATASVTANTAKVTNATHTGDVTGATALTIANNAVTLAKFQDIATASFLGRITAATGDPEVLTGTQATTLLNVFTSSLQGLVPLSGGLATEFLNGAGAFTVPAGGGGGGSGFNQTVVKLTDQTKTNDTTPALDDELFVTLAIGTYTVEARIYVNSGTVPDLLSTFAGTATFTGGRINGAFSSITAAPVGLITNNFLALTSGSNQVITVTCNVIVTVAGTFGYAWSQNTDSGVDTIIQEGSSLTVKDNSSGGGGGGDMVLADVQTVTGAKTFLDTTLLLRNVANSFNGSFVNTNTADRIYTLPDETGVISLIGRTETLLGKTLTTPTIVATGFTNMQHTHQAANTGGQLVATLALTATGTKDSTTFLRGDDTYAVPPSGGSTDAVKWKEPVIATTIANGVLATAYENGDTLDGVTLATGDRILLKDQTTGSENGVYTVNASGAPTRAVDFDGDDEVVGSRIPVMEGTINTGRAFRMTNTGTVTVGTTALVFTSFDSDIGCKATLTSNQSISNATTTDVNWTNEDYDTDTMHDTSTNNERVTFKTAGKYFIMANINYTADVDTRAIVFIVNQSGLRIGVMDMDPSAGGAGDSTTCAVYNAAVDDWIKVQVHQASGSAKSLDSGEVYFTAQKMDTGG